MRAILAFGQLEYVSRRYFAVGWATVDREDRPRGAHRLLVPPARRRRRLSAASPGPFTACMRPSCMKMCWTDVTAGTFTCHHVNQPCHAPPPRPLRRRRPPRPLPRLHRAPRDRRRRAPAGQRRLRPDPLRRHPRRARRHRRRSPPRPIGFNPMVNEALPGTSLASDPPVHTQLRAALSENLTPARAARAEGADRGRRPTPWSPSSWSRAPSRRSTPSPGRCPSRSSPTSSASPARCATTCSAGARRPCRSSAR